eukprot:g33711.t1
MLFLQFTFGLTLTMEEAEDGHVVWGLGGGVKVDGNQKVGLVGACGVQVVRKQVPESAFGLLDIEKTTLGAMDPVDEEIEMAGVGLGKYQVGGCGREISRDDDVVDGLGDDGLVIRGGVVIERVAGEGGGVRELVSGLSDVE